MVNWKRNLIALLPLSMRRVMNKDVKYNYAGGLAWLCDDERVRKNRGNENFSRHFTMSQ
jgi:hypothetical protein